MFGIDVQDLAPRQRVVIGGDTAFRDAVPHPPPSLPPGKYEAQAVFDGQRLESVWRREAGNLYGDVIEFELKDDGEPTTVKLALNHVVEGFEFPKHESLREFSVES